MKRMINYFMPIFCMSILISCESGQMVNRTETQQETPKALQNDKIEIKSYKRSEDLVDELYKELVDINPALKKLEEDLDILRPKVNRLNEEFNEYNSKSKSYYNSTDYKAESITDSILKKRIITLISKSNQQYLNKTSELNSLLIQISQNSATISDHHQVLKIVMTLPLIEKYQSDNLPNKNDFTDLIKNQKILIGQTDSLTPNY